MYSKEKQACRATVSLKYICSAWLAFLAGCLFSYAQESLPGQTTRLPATGPMGVYALQDGSWATLATMQHNYVLVLSDGTVRALRPGNGETMFEFGTAIATFDTIEGGIRLEDANEKLTLTVNGAVKTGNRIKLREREMHFRNGALRLQGSLLLPEGKGPFPLVILTHGSGYEKREESRALAYLFTGSGIAAFIYDKRGTDQPEETGDWKASFYDYAADATAAAAMLAKEKLIDGKRIGIFGHSQGGWVAPLAASRSALFSFVIISAGNAVTPVEQHLYNGACANRLAGVPEWAIKEIYEFRKIKYEAGITGNKEKFEAALPVAQSKPWFIRTGGELPGGTFWKLNGYYQPDTALRLLKCPVLVIAGELDRYSDTKTNMELFRKIFEESGNRNNVTFKVFPSANHAFLETGTGKLDEKEIPVLKRFVPGYFETLSRWTKNVTSR